MLVHTNSEANVQLVALSEEKILQVLRRLDVLAFLTAFLLAGLLWGLMETYLFWFMEDLGASKLLMGGSLAVGTIAGVPISIFSK